MAGGKKKKSNSPRPSSPSSAAAADVAELSRSISDFIEVQAGLDARLQSGQARLDVDFRALDDLTQAHASQLKACRRMDRMVAQVRQEELTDEQRAEVDECARRLRSCRASLGRLRDTKPKTGSLFLRLMMGRVNMKMWKRGEKLRFREEYEKFKFRTTFIFFFFPALQLFLVSRDATAAAEAQGGEGAAPDTPLARSGPLALVWKLHTLWMFYFYVSLALRENILQVNGSNIKSWYVYHHYLSMLSTGLVILFPRGLERAYVMFLWFALAQGAVMGLLNRYQSRRHYARRALGKAKETDIAATETPVEATGELFLIVPLLFALYAWELYFGLVLYRNSSADWLGPALGVIWLMLGTGNAVTVIRVLRTKRQIRRESKRA